jgi:APA family basic amino acid/polyamine antiporter
VTELPRTLSRFDATMIVMGTIIGIGIFFTPARVLLVTGNPARALASWGLGGVVALTGAFTFAQLGLLLPHAGGPYVYLREGLGRPVAFLYGWMSLMAIVSGAIAVIGFTFAEHLALLLPDALATEGTRRAVAVALVASLTLVNVVGMHWGARVQNVVTVLKVASLLGIIAVGLWKGSEPALSAAPLEGAETASRSFAAGVLAGMVGVMFSFGGWQNLNNVAAELKDVRRDLPWAIVAGVVGVAAVYLLANFAMLRLLPADELARSPVPAAAALEHAIGPTAGAVTAALILCSAFGIVNGLLLSFPRVYYAMGRDGLLFASFGRVHRRFRTPAVAVLAQGAIATAMLFVGGYAQLLDYVVFADWVFFFLGGVALFRIRRRLGAAAAALPRLGHPWLPLAFTACALAILVSVLIQQWENARFGLLVLAAGALVYALVLFRGRRAGPVSR